MKVEDTMYIGRGDVVLSIKIEAWKSISGDNSGTERPEDKSYPNEAAEFAEALEDVREALLELDEADDDHESE